MMMTNDLLLRMPQWLLPSPGETVVCAVSGGLDSMCLLDLLARRCGEERVIAAHFNHQLRPTADRDEAFVREYCEERGIPFQTGRGDVRALAKAEGLSQEEAARNLRYAFLRETAADCGAAKICTAHHADDNAETVLMNLVRGTGLAGLAGIPPCQDGVVRPLLDMTRAELAEYAAARGIPHVEDETNADPDAAARNFLRLQVMPLLKELNPKAVEHIAQTAAQARPVDRCLDDQARRAFVGLGTGPGWVSFPWESLRLAPLPLQPRLLLLLLEQMEVGRKDFGAVHFNAVLRLENEHSIDLPHGIVARRERGRLFLTRRRTPPAQAPLEQGTPLAWGGCTLTLLDRREGEGLALRLPDRGEGGALTVAPAPPGARLTLPGAKGSRSVKRLCLDKHISLEERDRLPAIYIDGRLAAVWQLGVDVEFLPEGKACRFIKINKETEESGI